MSASSPSTSPSQTWLLRVSTAFSGMETDILGCLGARQVKKLGREYHLVRLEDPDRIWSSKASPFIRWNLPVHHAWPCVPRDTEGFVEKAARALQRKFGSVRPQAILAASFDSGAPNSYYRTLASNLRGRTLQVFSGLERGAADAEEQNPDAGSLFCFVGKEGLYGGVQSPRRCNGFYPGGTKFVSQNQPATISRAGAKIAGALHHLKLHRGVPSSGAQWLELGASPGGMTSELLDRGYRVTAVDRAPLDNRLDGRPGLSAVVADAGVFRPSPGVSFDAVLSDMNGDARDSLGMVLRFLPFLKHHGLVVFTVKMPGVASFGAATDMVGLVEADALAAGLRVVSCTHLSHNRRELTLCLERN